MAFLIALSSVTQGQANERGATGRAVRDIELTQKRAILGQLVDNAGMAKPRQTVTVEQKEHVIAQAITDDDGRFTVPVISDPSG